MSGIEAQFVVCLLDDNSKVVFGVEEGSTPTKFIVRCWVPGEDKPLSRDADTLKRALANAAVNLLNLPKGTGEDKFYFGFINPLK